MAKTILQDGKISKVYSTEELTDAITSTIQHLENQIEYLKEQNKTLIDKGVAQYAVNRYKELIFGNGKEIFCMTTPLERERMENFRERHICTHPESFYYEIYPTEIANRIVMICKHCGEAKDITDYDSW